MRPLPHSAVGPLPTVVTREVIAQNIMRLMSIGRSPVGQQAFRRVLAMIDAYREDRPDAPPPTQSLDDAGLWRSEAEVAQATADRALRERGEMSGRLAAAQSELDELRHAREVDLAMADDLRRGVDRLSEISQQQAADIDARSAERDAARAALDTARAEAAAAATAATAQIATLEERVDELEARLAEQPQPAPSAGPMIQLTHDQIAGLLTGLMARTREADPSAVKWCSTCRQWKSPQEFHLRSRAHPEQGRHSQCAPCSNARRLQRKAEGGR